MNEVDEISEIARHRQEKITGEVGPVSPDGDGQTVPLSPEAEAVSDDPVIEDRKNGIDDATPPEPLVDLYNKPDRIGGLVLVGILIVIICGLAALYALERFAEPVLLAVIGGFAGVGAFFLFALLLGFIQLSSSKRSQNFSKQLANGLSSGVIAVDENGRIVYANKAYGDLTGAKSFHDLASIESLFSHNTQTTKTVYRMASAAKEGISGTQELRLPAGLNTADEGAKWFRLKASPLRLERGGKKSKNAALTVWQLSDVTAERQAQETAFEELQHAIHYLDHAPAGFFSSQPDGKIVYLNSTLADWLGIDLAMFKSGSISLSDFISSNGIALIEAAGPDENSSRTSVIDTDFLRTGAARIPVRLYHKVSSGEDGAPGTARTLVINRLAKEETDSALLDAELRFSRFFNNTPIAIASLSSTGKTVRTNTSFMGMFADVLEKVVKGGKKKKSTGQLLGEGVELATLVDEADRPAISQALKTALSGKVEAQMVDATMAEDKSRYLRVFLTPVFDETPGEDANKDSADKEDVSRGAQDERVVVYVMETTEQRALEEQFAQGQKMQAVGQLAGGVAHDFNNMLTAIIGFSDLLLANHRPSDPSFPDIMNIRQSANRAASLVRQLLAFSRRQTLRPQVLAVGEALADLRMMLSRLLGESIKLEFSHGRDLWPVKVDVSQFEQVIVNLVVNARDAMPDGGKVVISTANVTGEDVKARYQFKGMPAADYVLIEVVDEGTGMNEDILEKIFEPFFSTKEVGKGTGLGLSTVYGIIKQTGGFIYPVSKLGEGTSFLVFIPRHVADEIEVDETDAKAQKEAGKDLTGNATILLVEDEDAVRAFGSRALASRGYTVHEASSGVEALEVLEEIGGQVDLIVSDVVMPEMDGPTLFREVRKTHPDLRFIFVSGHAEDAFAKNLPEKEKERFGFLPKPFSLKDLATVVKDALEEDG